MDNVKKYGLQFLSIFVIGFVVLCGMRAAEHFFPQTAKINILVCSVDDAQHVEVCKDIRKLAAEGK